MLGAMRLASLVLSLALLGCTSTRADGTVTCAPGSGVSVGCDGVSLGECDGDPVLRVCNGTLGIEECRAATDGVVEEDDTVGLCPRVTVECPASGVITVTTRPLVRDADYVCDWQVADLVDGPATDAGGVSDPDAGPGPAPSQDAGPGITLPDAGSGSDPDAGPGGPTPPG